MSQSSSKVNMSLDDIIKQRRAENTRGRRGRMSRGRSNRRNFGERRRYLKKTVPADKTLINNQEKRTRLFISNLQKEVINSELRKIFNDCGALKRCGIHWDKMGYSLGTADVEFEKPEDAQKAIEKFDNAEIEGTAMKVEYSKSNGHFGKGRTTRGKFQRGTRYSRAIGAIRGRGRGRGSRGGRGGRRKVLGRRRKIAKE